MSVWGTDKITLIGTQEIKELREQLRLANIDSFQNEAENQQLRELNARLLKTLRAIAITAESSSSVALWAREAIAKAEALK